MVLQEEACRLRAVGLQHMRRKEFAAAHASFLVAKETALLIEDEAKSANLYFM